MRQRVRGGVAPAVVFVVGLWLTAGAWGKRPPSGDDVMGVIARAEEGMRVLSSLHLDGWSPRFLVGFPIFLHYGPGLSLVYAALRVVTFGALSPAGAIQVLFAVSFAAVGPAVWFLARSLGMNTRSALFAGVLAFAVNSPFGVGMAGLYTIGLLPHALAAPLVFVGLGAAVRAVRDDDRRWVLVVAASFGFVIVTHIISTLVAAFFVAVFALGAVSMLASWPARLDALRRLAIGGAGAAGLAAVWLVPYVVHFSSRGVPPAWSTDTLHHRVDEIIAGHFVLGHYQALFVVAGWAWALTRRGANRMVVVPPLAAVSFLVVAHWYHAHSPASELSQQLANRGIGYAVVLAILPLAGFLDDAIPQRLGDSLRLGVGLVLALFVVVVLPGKPGLRSVAKQQGEPTAVARSTAAFLRGAVPRGARFATERDFPNETTTIGMTHADFWLAAAAGRNTSNTYGLEQSQSGFAGSLGENLKNDVKGEFTARRFAQFGVTHVVTLEPTARERMLGTGQFRSVFADGDVAVLEVRPPKGTPQPSSLFMSATRASAQPARVSDDAEHYAIKVQTAAPAVATVALGVSPYWQVRVDGKATPVTKSPDGLVSFVVPQGRHLVTVDYDRDKWNLLGALVSLATVAALALWARRGAASRPACARKRADLGLALAY